MTKSLINKLKINLLCEEKSNFNSDAFIALKTLLPLLDFSKLGSFYKLLTNKTKKLKFTLSLRFIKCNVQIVDDIALERFMNLS